MHLVDARLDEAVTFIGFDDGDRVALIRRDGIRSPADLFVSAVKIVEGGEVAYEAAEVRLPLFERFGWALVGEGPDPVVLALSYADEFVLTDRTTYVIAATAAQP